MKSFPTYFKKNNIGRMQQRSAGCDPIIKIYKHTLILLDRMLHMLISESGLPFFRLPYMSVRWLQSLFRERERERERERGGGGGFVQSTLEYLYKKNINHWLPTRCRIQSYRLTHHFSKMFVNGTQLSE